MSLFERGSHNVGLSNYHLQFTPKYRVKVFVDPVIREACRKSFHATAGRLGVRIAAMEFGPDHVHMFVEGCRNYSVPQLVQAFKGASSRLLRQQHWPRVKRYLWNRFFWSGGYFYEAVGRITSENIRFYIERQQGHPLDGHRPHRPLVEARPIGATRVLTVRPPIEKRSGL